MNPPKLRLHKSGNYMVRWGGRDRYLGRDKADAQKQYEGEIAEWLKWREQKRAMKAAGSRMNLDVLSLVERFAEAKLLENGKQSDTYYRKLLVRFIARTEKLRARDVTPAHLNALKMDMISDGFAPKTINHDLTAVRVMFAWAAGIGLVPPIDFSGVRNMAVGPTDDVSISAKEVKSMVDKAPDVLRPWLAINYLALLRPSEVVRVVHRQGEWVDDGVFRLDRGKMDKRVSIKRHCLFSPAALVWFEQCEPRWSRLDSYSTVARRHCKYGPKVLQKSAAAHLVQNHDADPADVELLLGHVPSRLSVTYYHPAWQRLRTLASRITL